MSWDRDLEEKGSTYDVTGWKRVHTAVGRSICTFKKQASIGDDEYMKRVPLIVNGFRFATAVLWTTLMVYSSRYSLTLRDDGVTNLNKSFLMMISFILFAPEATSLIKSMRNGPLRGDISKKSVSHNVVHGVILAIPLFCLVYKMYAVSEMLSSHVTLMFVILIPCVSSVVYGVLLKKMVRSKEIVILVVLFGVYIVGALGYGHMDGHYRALKDKGYEVYHLESSAPMKGCCFSILGMTLIGMLSGYMIYRSDPNGAKENGLCTEIIFTTVGISSLILGCFWSVIAQLSTDQHFFLYKNPMHLSTWMLYLRTVLHIVYCYGFFYTYNKALKNFSPFVYYGLAIPTSMCICLIVDSLHHERVSYIYTFLLVIPVTLVAAYLSQVEFRRKFDNHFAILLGRSGTNDGRGGVFSPPLDATDTMVPGKTLTMVERFATMPRGSCSYSSTSFSGSRGGPLAIESPRIDASNGHLDGPASQESKYAPVVEREVSNVPNTPCPLGTLETQIHGLDTQTYSMGDFPEMSMFPDIQARAVVFPEAMDNPEASTQVMAPHYNTLPRTPSKPSSSYHSEEQREDVDVVSRHNVYVYSKEDLVVKAATEVVEPVVDKDVIFPEDQVMEAAKGDLAAKEDLAGKGDSIVKPVVVKRSSSSSSNSSSTQSPRTQVVVSKVASLVDQFEKGSKGS